MFGFRNIVPFSVDSQGHGTADAILPLWRGSGTILLVEDEDALREIGR